MADSCVRVSESTVWLPGGAAVSFLRTLREPETGAPDMSWVLGGFPVRRVVDHPDTVPEQWRARGGVMLPVYPQEAVVLAFDRTEEPTALQVGAGTGCAVSGGPWSDRLSRKPQNYLVLPRQRWFTPVGPDRGTVRRLGAALLGLGARAKGRAAGEEVGNSLQLRSFPLTDGALTAWHRSEEQRRLAVEWLPQPYGVGGYVRPLVSSGGAAMGGSGGGFWPWGPEIALRWSPPGNYVEYLDEWLLSDWSEEPAGGAFVHLVAPPEWHGITGEDPPPPPVNQVRRGFTPPAR